MNTQLPKVEEMIQELKARRGDSLMIKLDNPNGKLDAVAIVAIGPFAAYVYGEYMRLSSLLPHDVEFRELAKNYHETPDITIATPKLVKG